ncbi:melanopsin-like [Paramacrobiotus metropolitanus]|uniref:melanopsin-like n=1 Tax=Paramacrobiotus metropolitanus TaxID=2943436 RepID=UPI00244639C0|nr:melanopsin-like [Paramacrobiotus metropolitanus]
MWIIGDSVNGVTNYSSPGWSCINDTSAAAQYGSEPHQHLHWLVFFRNGELPAPTWFHMATGVYMLCIGCLGTLGNGILAWAFLWCKALRSPSNLLIGNLAVADFCMSMTTFPFFITSSFAQRWLYGKIGCDYYGFSGGLFGMVGISTMASIAVDRYLSITHWQHWSLTYPQVAVWISALWLYAASLCIPPFFGWSAYILEGVQTSCTFDFLSGTPASISFTLWLVFIGFAVPVSIIIYCYSKLLRYIADHQKVMENVGFGYEAPGRNRLNSNVTNRSDPSGTDRSDTPTPSDIRAATTCAVIVALFCLAWTPYACVALTGTFGHADLLNPYASSVPSFFAKSSAIYNPIVYALMNERFRTAVLVMLRLRREPSRRRPGNLPRTSEPAIYNVRHKRASATLSTTFSIVSGPISPTSPLAPTGLQRSSIDEGQEDGLEMGTHEGVGVLVKVKREMRWSLDLDPVVTVEGPPGTLREVEGEKAEKTADDEMLLTPTPMTECFGCSVLHTRE